MAVFRFSRVDFFFTCLGLFMLLMDICLDIRAAVQFFQEGEYVRLGLLVLFLLGSSLLVQTYSWLWYWYEDFERQTKVERVPSLTALKVLHLLQLGTYLRHLGVMEIAFHKFLFPGGRGSDPGDVGVYLSHDVAMLRIVEAFSESLPQLVLMVTTNIQRGHLDTIIVLKSVGSALAVSFCVTSYHRSLRHFLKDKKKQTLPSSVVYFLWNVLLIAARVAALSLFASAFPCGVLPHFLCSWILLVFCAWRSQTDFMNDTCGEWLYRATVGLIWFFNWFNVSEGRSRWRSLLYHAYIWVDLALLCGLWFWKTNTDLRGFRPQHLAVCLSVPFVYLLGLLVKFIYYHCLHPNVTKDGLQSERRGLPGEGQSLSGEGRDVIEVPHLTIRLDVVDFKRANGPTPAGDSVSFRNESPAAPTEPTKVNKRMMKLAQNFYS